MSATVEEAGISNATEGEASEENGVIESSADGSVEDDGGEAGDEYDEGDSDSSADSDDSDEDEAPKKIVYNHEFLLGFRKQCTEKPPGLPDDLAIVIGNEGISNSRGSKGHRNRRNMTKSKDGDRRRRKKDKGGRGDRRSSSSRNDADLPPVAPLVASENRWQRPASDGDDTNATLRQVNSILNKLTLEKFETLTRQLISIGINSKEVLRGIMRLIFDKALREPKFSQIYADLCKRLSAREVCPTFKDDDGSEISFRRVLLNKCQEEFENDPDPQKLEDLTGYDLEEYLGSFKKRTLGNIKFIGELYQAGLLGPKIVYHCIRKLTGELEDEDSVESLCKLLTTIGKLIDHKDGAEVMNIVLEQLSSKKDTFSSRIRFMVMDLLDLRANRWVPRRDDDGPMTIEEVHREAKRKEHAQARALSRSADMLPSGRGRGPSHGRRPSSGGGSSRGGGGSNSGGGGSGEWEVAGGSGRRKGDRKAMSRSTDGKGGSGGGGGGGGGGWETVGGGSGKGARRDKKGGGGREELRSSRNRNRDSNKEGSKGWRSSSRDESAANSFSALADEQKGRYQPPGQRKRGGGGGGGGGNKGRGGRDQHQKAEAKPTGPTFTQEQLGRKADALLEEYMSIHDPQEAIECVKELNSPAFHPEVVNKALNIALEKGEKEQKLLDDLLTGLCKERVITGAQLEEGFGMVLEFLEDFIIDIPFAHKYMARFIGSAIVNKTIEISYLPRGLAHLIECGLAPKIVIETLAVIYAKTNAKVMMGYILEAKLEFKMFLPEEKKDSAQELLAELVKPHGSMGEVLIPKKTAEPSEGATEGDESASATDASGDTTAVGSEADASPTEESGAGVAESSQQGSEASPESVGKDNDAAAVVEEKEVAEEGEGNSATDEPSSSAGHTAEGEQAADAAASGAEGETPLGDAPDQAETERSIDSGNNTTAAAGGADGDAGGDADEAGAGEGDEDGGGAQ